MIDLLKRKLLLMGIITGVEIVLKSIVINTIDPQRSVEIMLKPGMAYP